MADPKQQPVVVFEVLPAFYLYSDGSVQRSDLRPPIPPSPQDGVAFKDLTLHAHLGLWARLYLPQVSTHTKLPLIVFFHGSGFITSSPSDSHSFCVELSKRTGAIFLSASYRLAPEHRLPAAFDDAFFAFQWLHSQALLLHDQGKKEEVMEPWLANADFSRFFVCGVSAGGTIGHRVAMQALNKPWSPEFWTPLRIRGIISIHAAFARSRRSPEEERLPFDPLMNWHMEDMIFKLGLPEGSSRDDPMVSPVPELVSGGVTVPPRALVALAANDVLHFVGAEYAEALKQAGCRVDLLMSEGVGHGFFVLQPFSAEAETLYQKIVQFINDVA